jgi:hypothetical protein
MLIVGLCLLGGFAHANLPGSNITLYDGEGGGLFGTPGGADNYGAGQTQEDQEVHSGCIANQSWDLEGMQLNNQTLTLVGGWNFMGGQLHDHYTYRSGDIFIATGNAASDVPLYGSTAPTIPGSPTMADYHYDYVIHVTDWSTGAYQVISNAGSAVELISYSSTSTTNNGSNPWRYASGGTVIANGNFTHQEGLSDATTGFNGGSHNTVSFNMAWLNNILNASADPNQDIYYHFTMECGNDNLMGHMNNGDFVPPVPEPASIGLFGMGLIGLAAARIRKKRV